MLIDRIKNMFLKTINNNNNLSIEEKRAIQQKLEKLQDQEVNFLIIGGTGVGKSSTVNALFKNNNVPIEHAKIGLGPNPETQSITPYKMGNITFWDTPGIGESTNADIRHLRAINSKLQEKSTDGSLLIDFVLIIIDGSSRDLNSLFRLLNVIKITLGPQNNNRIIVAINKIDSIKSGHGWDIQNNRPLPKLEKYIVNCVESVKQRIKDNSNLDITPIPYCAGYQNEFATRSPYNIADLLCAMLNSIVPEKRIVMLQQTKEKVFHEANKEQKEKFKKHASSGLGPAIIGRIGLGLLTGGILGGCFITTAVCQSQNKSDNCHMLYLFRHFRDKWLLKQTNGETLIENYYKKAPEIVAFINSLPQKSLIYQDIYNDYLQPCYKMLKHKKFNACKNHYIKMVNDLSIKFSI